MILYSISSVKQKKKSACLCKKNQYWPCCPTQSAKKAEFRAKKNFNAGLGVLDWACQHAALEADKPEDIGTLNFMDLHLNF